MEKLARYVGKEKKIGVKLIVSAHLLERISQVASTHLEIGLDSLRTLDEKGHGCILVYPLAGKVLLELRGGKRRHGVHMFAA